MQDNILVIEQMEFLDLHLHHSSCARKTELMLFRHTVLLHKDVGFINQQDQTDNSIRKISRELFTDLNKNAKTVDRARELILDDKSIHARCVRTLVTNTTPQDDTNSLPLSLVRWQDNNNRFDESYYLNSLVHLDLIVKDLLSLKEPSDPMDARKVKKFIFF